MRWYRCHRRFAGLLALFALGVQLVVSFAHVHLEGARPPFGVSVLDATPHGDGSPAAIPHAPGAPHHDYCAVCVALGLLSNGLRGEPPVISLPDLVRFAPLPRVSEYRISIARFHPFRTRAPPVA
jgi:hypothetical protein